MDYLKQYISKYPSYSLIHVSDEIMCFNKDEMPDRRARVLARKQFTNNLYIMVVCGYFYVGVYKYARPVSLQDWIVVFKVTHGAMYKIQSVIEAIATASQQAPIFLLRQETFDYVASIPSQTGVNKKHAAGILQVIILDGIREQTDKTRNLKKIPIFFVAGTI